MSDETCTGKAEGGGPCHNQPLPNKTKCNRCSILYANSNPKARVSAYQLGRWQDRMAKLSSEDQVSHLFDEIGILKMMLESILALCKTEADLVIHSHRVIAITQSVEKLITSTHRLQKSNGALLDKSILLQLAGKIIGIIQKHISDPEIIEAIANEIIEEVSSADGSEKSE